MQISGAGDKPPPSKQAKAIQNPQESDARLMAFHQVLENDSQVFRKLASESGYALAESGKKAENPSGGFFLTSICQY